MRPDRRPGSAPGTDVGSWRGLLTGWPRAVGAAGLALAVRGVAGADLGGVAESPERILSELGSSRNPLVESTSESEHLTGNWGGWRNRFRNRGFHFQAGYIGETVGNVAGGRRVGAVYEGLAEAALELTPERLWGGWAGATLRVSGLFPHGKSPSGELVGDVQTASNIDAYDSVALYELWLEQRFFDDRWSLRAGQLLADTEFAFTESGGALMNSSFGWPAFISLNTRNTGPAYFRAAPGVRARAELGAGLLAQAAVYDGDTFDRDDGRASGNPHGTHFRLSEQQGAFLVGEVGWRREGTVGRPLPLGPYKLGMWGHTSRFDDLRVPDRRHRGNYGLYLAVEQELVSVVEGEKEGEGQGQGGRRPGLAVFARAGLTPGDRNFARFAGDVGCQCRGLLPGRTEDALTVAVAGVWVSSDWRRAERDAGALVLSDREVTIEGTYQWRVRPWLTVQPDVQWIHHPGASSALADAVAFGLRTRITF